MSEPRQQCIAETVRMLNRDQEDKIRYPKLYGMGLLDWTIEELLIVEESRR